MNRPACLDLPLLAITFIMACSFARGAELSMNWEGHDSDGVREIQLAVAQQAVIEYHINLQAGDTLSGVFFTNESQSLVSQLGTIASPAGWEESSVDGLFSDVGQQFVVSASGADAVIAGAGDVLLGTQTIQLVDGAAGDQIEIAISLAQLGVIDENGGFYALTATGTPFQDLPGFVHLGVGSPGYSRNNVMDVREPLVIRVAEASNGGGGGGGTGGGDDGNDNTNTNDNGADNANDNGTDTTNDNQNTNDNSAANGNDNGAGDDNTNDNQNTNDNSGGNANDNSPGNDNQNTNDNSTGNGNGGDDDQPSGLCGLGMVSVLPLNLLGLWVMRRRR